MTITDIKTARALGFSLAALESLLQLAEHEDLPMTSLALEVSVTTASMTSIADNLCKRGMIRRVPSLSDRRSINLTVTEKGRATVFQLTGTYPQPLAQA